MGKIVAIGGGRYDNGEIVGIVKEIRDLCDKEKPGMLFLPTAGYDDIDGDEYMEQAFRDNGCETDRLFLTDKMLTYAQTEEKIMSADIIYAGGGDLGFLTKTWRETGVDKLLKKAYEKGAVLSGYSSGAMCWFNSGYDDCGKDHAFIFLDCLSLLPFCNCPHFESDSWQSFAERIKERGEHGIAIEDGAALIYNGSEFRCVSGNEDGDVYFFDKNDSYRQIKITENPNILKKYM